MIPDDTMHQNNTLRLVGIRFVYDSGLSRDPTMTTMLGKKFVLLKITLSF